MMIHLSNLRVKKKHLYDQEADETIKLEEELKEKV